jgi:hypothetical protein
LRPSISKTAECPLSVFFEGIPLLEVGELIDEVGEPMDEAGGLIDNLFGRTDKLCDQALFHLFGVTNTLP